MYIYIYIYMYRALINLVLFATAVRFFVDYARNYVWDCFAEYVRDYVRYFFVYARRFSFELAQPI